MNIKRGLIILAIIAWLASCNEDESNVVPVADFEFSDGIDRIVLDGKLSSDPDGDALSYRWTSNDKSIVFGTLDSEESYFKIPNHGGEMDIDIILTVSDGISENTKTQTVHVPEFSQVRSYGLGKVLNHEISNDVLYDWYIDQAITGPHSLVNCGPTSVIMAIKWFDGNFDGTPEEARQTYNASGGWWYSNNIIDYLNKFGVDNRTILLDNISRVKEEIDYGNIVILCLDMYAVQDSADPEYHVNKFYETRSWGWGHFLVVKGYKQVDGQTFYEVYDSNSLGVSYSAGGLKGKDRYYSAVDLDAATSYWWDYAIVIQKSGSVGGRKGVNVDEIVHMPGR